MSCLWMSYDCKAKFIYIFIYLFLRTCSGYVAQNYSNLVILLTPPPPLLLLQNTEITDSCHHYIRSS